MLTSGTLPAGSNRELRGKVNFQTHGHNSSVREANSSSSGNAKSGADPSQEISEVVKARSGVGVLPQETAFFNCLSVRKLTKVLCLF